jgi:hypothetical protein
MAGAMGSWSLAQVWLYFFDIQRTHIIILGKAREIKFDTFSKIVSNFFRNRFHLKYVKFIHGNGFQKQAHKLLSINDVTAKGEKLGD